MGGTCAKLVSVKTSKAFKNKIHSLPLPQNEVDSNKVGDSTLEDNSMDRVTQEKGEPNVQVECSDIYSKGDHNEEKSEQLDEVTTGAEQYTIEQHKFAQGDYKKEEKTNDNHSIFQVQNYISVLEEPTIADKAQNMATEGTVNTNVEESQDVNDNSFNRHLTESETQYSIDVKGLDSPNCDETEDNVPATPREPKPPEDKKAEKTEEVLTNIDSIPQDSLFFLPLDNDRERPPATYKVPERLSRTRKPPLSYSERMLLADCNRFQQLDKKREFAVRQNRSMSRIGKLPKIADSKGEPSENDASKSINASNNPDD